MYTHIYVYKVHQYSRRRQCQPSGTSGVHLRAHPDCPMKTKMKKNEKKILCQPSGTSGVHLRAHPDCPMKKKMKKNEKKCKISKIGRKNYSKTTQKLLKFRIFWCFFQKIIITIFAFKNSQKKLRKA